MSPPGRRRRPPALAGIIAAGIGARLAGRRPHGVKPLVPISGRPLCHWVVCALAQAGIRDFTLLLNSRGTAIRESLREAFPAAHWTFLQQDTASSWESFRLVAKTLAERADSFLISTVDSLIAPAEVARFTREIGENGAEAGLALTAFVDDEKPLWADLGANGLVTALGEAAHGRRYATAGLYSLTSSAARKMPPPGDFRSLREYLGSLVQSGGVAGIPVEKAVDVDRPEDILEAQGFLKANPTW